MNDRHRYRVWDGENKVYAHEGYVVTQLGLVGTYDPFVGLIRNINCTVEHCTGLKDRNGKLIYEGDFVQISFRDTTLRYCVRYDQASCQLYLSAGEQEFSESFEVIDNWSIEIIGNIHEMEVEKLRDCESCHGTGYLKSRCDEPDRVCPICNGTGRDD